MEQNNERKSYSREFKLAAVKMSQEPSKTVAQVARELDIRENDLHNWRNIINEHGDQAFPGQGRRANNSDYTQLKRENERLKEENAILKKAAIFFAKETGKNMSL